MVVGGYWIVITLLSVLEASPLVEICVEKNSVALPVGKALTWASCKHVSKNIIGTRNCVKMVICARARELLRLETAIKPMLEA